MKTIDDLKNKLISDTQEQLKEINDRYMKSMRAMNITSEIMESVMPSMKKLHLPSYSSIHVNVLEDSNWVGISLNMDADDKFKFYKRSYYESNWWKKNKPRINKKVEKITDTIIKSCDKYEIKVRVNEYSLINEGSECRKTVLMTISFEMPEVSE